MKLSTKIFCNPQSVGTKGVNIKLHRESFLTCHIRLQLGIKSMAL